MGVFEANSALLIVDMINDFVQQDGALHVPNAKKILPKISDLIAEARRSTVPVIYINDSHDPDDAEFQRWPVHAITGTNGAMVAEGIEPANEDRVIEKKSFSAFYETGLESLLLEHGVNHIVITGTVTNVCIFATALDATMRGFAVSVPEDGVAGIDDKDHRFALQQIENVLGGRVL